MVFITEEKDSGKNLGRIQYLRWRGLYFAKNNRYTISESFYEALWSSRVLYASLKMLILSRLHSAVYNLIS